MLVIAPAQHSAAMVAAQEHPGAACAAKGSFGECLAIWPHEPHDAHSLRREKFETSSFSSYILLRASKQKLADVSNFEGSRKINFDQI